MENDRHSSFETHNAHAFANVVAFGARSSGDIGVERFELVASLWRDDDSPLSQTAPFEAAAWRARSSSNTLSTGIAREESAFKAS